MFRPGQRIQFTWSHYEPNDWGDSDENKLIFTGTVVSESGLRFIVRVDDLDGLAADDASEPMHPKMVFRNERLVIKLKPSDMSALNEERRTICQACCAYDGEIDRCHGQGDPRHWDSYWPSECLHLPQANAEAPPSPNHLDILKEKA
ncbi:hypothetical protein [uncultured Roseobacter sp.]|uniref:hypothetical protein n=1 Tax=uncultured Roseobacter sp. TaxID=114847 RepID=UPI0026315490|nr:hypothetical protein [uncultured Roseobacter sp.]